MGAAFSARADGRPSISQPSPDLPVLANLSLHNYVLFTVAIHGDTAVDKPITDGKYEIIIYTQFTQFD